MKCKNCAIELPIQQGYCPNCGAIIPPVVRESFGNRHPKVLIVFCLAIFVVVGEAVFFAYHWAVNNRPRLETAHSGDQRPPSPRSQFRNTEYPVEHGESIRPEELNGHGQL